MTTINFDANEISTFEEYLQKFESYIEELDDNELVELYNKLQLKSRNHDIRPKRLK